MHGGGAACYAGRVLAAYVLGELLLERLCSSAHDFVARLSPAHLQAISKPAVALGGSSVYLVSSISSTLAPSFFT